MTKLHKLYTTQQKIFTIDDLSVIWGQNRRSDTVLSADWYVRSGALTRIWRGVYRLSDATVSESEIANKLVVPSYISGQTVLARHFLTFQVTGTIHSVAPKTKSIAIDQTTFSYHAVKPAVFNNDLGIERVDGVNVASLERAVADLLYYSKGRYQFEDLSKINWQTLRQIAKIYGQKSLIKKVKELEGIWHTT
jgi:predicted transcriptional regulator of viral defense system